MRGFAASARFGAFVGAWFIAALSLWGGVVWFVGHNDGLVNEGNGRRGLRRVWRGGGRWEIGANRFRGRFAPLFGATGVLREEINYHVGART